MVVTEVEVPLHPSTQALSAATTPTRNPTATTTTPNSSPVRGRTRKSHSNPGSATSSPVKTGDQGEKAAAVEDNDDDDDFQEIEPSRKRRKTKSPAKPTPAAIAEDKVDEMEVTLLEEAAGDDRKGKRSLRLRPKAGDTTPSAAAPQAVKEGADRNSAAAVPLHPFFQQKGKQQPAPAAAGKGKKKDKGKTAAPEEGNTPAVADPPAGEPTGPTDLLEIDDFFLNKERRAEKRQLEASIKFKERYRT